MKKLVLSALFATALALTTFSVKADSPFGGPNPTDCQMDRCCSPPCTPDWCRSEEIVPAIK